MVEALRDIKMPNVNRKLIVTGPKPVHFEVSFSGIRVRNDLKTQHEEADTIIVSQMLSVVEEGYTRILKVICDDTGVFILFLYHFGHNNLQEKQPAVYVLMRSTSSATTGI